MSAVALVEREMREFVPQIVRQSGETAKVIALFAETTPRTVENWGDGQCLPSAPRLIVLAAKYPALRQKVNEWMDAISGESGDDPRKILHDVYHMLAERL